MLPKQPSCSSSSHQLEIMSFRLWTHIQDSILLCVCYRPQWQSGELLHYLTIVLDVLLLHHSRKHLIIMGDLNHHLVQRQFDEMLTSFELSNHVSFPTHISDFSFVSEITDLPGSMVTFRPLEIVESLNHLTVLNKIKLQSILSRGSDSHQLAMEQGDLDCIESRTEQHCLG